MGMWGAIAYRLEGRTLNRENPVSNPIAVASNFGKFDHPTLPLFTQLYKLVPGNTDSGGNVND